MSKYTAQDLETLRKQAQEVEKVLAAQQSAREQAYAAQQAALRAQREEALRQAYISQQQALTQLPGQLAQAGINGGPAESSIVQLNRAYGRQRADIYGGYAQGYGDLLVQKATDDADAAAQAAQNRMDYLGAESVINAQLAEQARQEQLDAQRAAQQDSWAKQFAALQKEIAALRSRMGGGQSSAPQSAVPTAPVVSTAKPEKTYPTRPVKSNSQLVGHVDLVW